MSASFLTAHGEKTEQASNFMTPRAAVPPRMLNTYPPRLFDVSSRHLKVQIEQRGKNKSYCAGVVLSSDETRRKLGMSNE